MGIAHVKQVVPNITYNSRYVMALGKIIITRHQDNHQIH